MDYIQGFNRNQVQMLCFEEFVGVDSWARIVDLFVEVLPLAELKFNDELCSKGRPPYK